MCERFGMQHDSEGNGKESCLKMPKNGEKYLENQKGRLEIGLTTKCGTHRQLQSGMILMCPAVGIASPLVQ